MDEILKYALDNGMINLTYLQEQIDMKKRQELLKQHPYAIWNGTDGNWHTYLPDKEKGRVHKKRKTKKEIEDVIIEYLEEQQDNPTINEVFKEWIDRRLDMKKISPSTHLRYTQIYERHYKEFGKRRIKSLTEEEITDFLESQIPEYNLTAKGFGNLKCITRGLLKRAKKRKLICFNVEAVLDELDTSERDYKKVIKENYEEVFDETELPIIMNYLISNKDILNLGILLMFVTGARIGEIVSLKYEDFQENSFKIRRTETRYLNENGKYVCDVKEYPKTPAGVRTVIIPDDFVWIIKDLRRLNPFGDYVFMKNGKRVTAHNMRRKLTRVCDKLGIYRKSPHKIRKTYCSILLDNNIDNLLITEQMGHTDIEVSEKYYHRNRKAFNKKAKIISNIPELKIGNV